MSGPSHEATVVPPEEAVERAAADPARPALHFRPPAGWMNDPNGMIWRDGAFHLFYQHNPHGDRWGHIHWGHAVSRDLVRWEHRPVALAPSRAEGEAHCFTGSAWCDHSGSPMLFYTSVAAEECARPNEQWAVHCDDRLSCFRKSAENPILSLEEHTGPPFRGDWRDPFVFREAGREYLILGTCLEEQCTAGVALYESESPDLLDWRYRGLLHGDPTGEVEFFECPNLLHLDEEHLLVYSAHRPVEYLAGCFDPEADEDALFVSTEAGRLDHSTQFYAAGRVADAPGDAPLVVGWVRGWNPGRGWNGTLSLPRVLARGPNGSLRQSLVPALSTLRIGPGAEAEARTLSGRMALEGLTAPCLEVRASLRPGSAPTCGLRLLRADDREPLVTVRWRDGSGGGRIEVEGNSWELPLHLGEASRREVGSSQPRVTAFPAAPVDGRLELRLVWDRSLLELFAREGRDACTRVIDGRGDPVMVDAFAAGGDARLERLHAWRLREVW